MELNLNKEKAYSYISGIIVFLFLAFLALIALIFFQSYIEILVILYFGVSIGKLLTSDKVSWNDDAFFVNNDVISFNSVKYVTINCSPFTVFIRGFYYTDCTVSLFTNDGECKTFKVYNYSLLSSINNIFKDKILTCKLPFGLLFVMFNLLFWACFLSPTLLPYINH